MSESETSGTLQQVNAVMIDVRNEAIVQSANAYLLGRKLVLAGLGATMLGIDSLQACAQRAIERGEIAEKDTRRLASDLQQQAIAHVKAAEQARSKFSEVTAAALLENVNGVLKIVGIPEVRMESSGAPAQPHPEPPGGTGSEAGQAPPSIS